MFGKWATPATRILDELEKAEYEHKGEESEYYFAARRVLNLHKDELNVYWGMTKQASKGLDSFGRFLDNNYGEPNILKRIWWKVFNRKDTQKAADRIREAFNQLDKEEE